MTTRALILSLLLCAVIAACAVQIPDAIDYELDHQRQIAKIDPPVNYYYQYQKFIGQNP